MYGERVSYFDIRSVACMAFRLSDIGKVKIRGPVECRKCRTCRKFITLLRTNNAKISNAALTIGALSLLIAYLYRTNSIPFRNDIFIMLVVTPAAEIKVTVTTKNKAAVCSLHSAQHLRRLFRESLRGRYFLVFPLAGLGNKLPIPWVALVGVHHGLRNSWQSRSVWGSSPPCPTFII